jgi:MFS family permease
MGYPIITIISGTSSPILGIASYTVFMAVSAMAGFRYSSFASTHELGLLSLAGYFMAAVGSLAFVIILHFSLPTILLYAGVGIIAFGTGAIETFEPTIVSRISSTASAGKSMGWLSSSRSIGMFTGNIIMGFLYSLNSEYSYLYAFIVAFAASLIVIIGGKGYRTSGSSA